MREESHELLLEFFSEEIPARMQKEAARQLEDKLASKLQEYKLSYTEIKTYVTPRRLAAIVTGLPIHSAASTERKRGPRSDGSRESLKGFVQKNIENNKKHASNVEVTIEQLKANNALVDIDGYWYFIAESPSKNTEELLSEIIQYILGNFHWPKSMRWSNKPFRWIRPLHNVLAVFNERPIALNLPDIYSEPYVWGHRVISAENSPGSESSRFSDRPQIKSFSDYKYQLEKNGVIISREERMKAIEEQIRSQLSGNSFHKQSLKLVPDPELLELVAGLVEFPHVLMGNIDPKFMDLPEELLISFMRNHQFYFSIRYNNERLAPYFLVVSNVPETRHVVIIQQGYERVLQARLSDAQFFYNQDLACTLEHHGEKLNQRLFHNRLGTMADKIERMQALAPTVWRSLEQVLLTEKLPEKAGLSLAALQRAIALCKADLATSVVNEFPELQGIMGSYYAATQQEHHDICTAIREHYSPKGLEDAVPSKPLSILLAITDQIDNLTGFFMAKLIPSGSRDPFALRRSALGLIRIIRDNHLSIELAEIINAAYEIFSQQFKSESKTEYASLPELMATLAEFFSDRLLAILKNENIPHKVAMAAVGRGVSNIATPDQQIKPCINVLLCFRLAEALRDLIATEIGEKLLSGYQRAANIVEIEQKKQKEKYSGNYETNLFKHEAERSLDRALKNAEKQMMNVNTQDQISVAEIKRQVDLLAGLQNPIDEFFKAVMVNDSDPQVRTNRLNLLAAISKSCSNIADLRHFIVD